MAKFDAHLKCSFCGKSQDQVRKLIAGPGVYICDECIDLCNEILDEELLDNQANTNNSPTVKILIQLIHKQLNYKNQIFYSSALLEVEKHYWRKL